jgi:Mitochondrial carrier protein
MTVIEQIPLLAKNLIRGAVLRVASDLSGGTPLESIKCRVTGTKDGPLKATRDIIREGGLQNLWTGTPSRTVEGALMGAIFMLGSTLTKKQMILLGASKTTAALAGGLVGGVAQSIVMTPAAMVFTSLNLNRGKKGYENDNALTVAQRIIKEKGIGGTLVLVWSGQAAECQSMAGQKGSTQLNSRH